MRYEITTKVSTFLIFLGLLIFSISNLQAKGSDNPISIKPVKSEDLTQLKDNQYERVSFQSFDATYFGNQTSQFLLDFSTLDKQRYQADSFRIMINRNPFYVQKLEPLLIEGLPFGTTTIEVQERVRVNPDSTTMKSHGEIEFKYLKNKPLFTNDAVVLGILIGLLALIFITATSSLPVFKRFYTYVPPLLLCYFLPSVFTVTNVFHPETSSLYHIASRFLLPASLVLLTLSIDLPGVKRLGFKSVIMFVTGTVGIVIGGPLAVLIVGTFAPEIVGGEGPEAVWRGLTTVAGTWIGGGANQTAMYEIWDPGDQLFSAVIAVDVIVANIWMAVLLYGAGVYKWVDKLFKADASAIEEVKQRIENYNLSVARIPSFPDIMNLLAVGLGMTAVGHLIADFIAPWIEENAEFLKAFNLTSKFFWIMVVVTTAGLLLSFTKARRLEGVGASKLGSAFLYILVATIGMKMNILAIFDNPGLFLVGGIWMLIHVVLLLSVGKFIKAPFFFTAVGSQANVGGAASAPIVASAFHPSLAPVGVLLAVLGYALGTYAAYFCGVMLKVVGS